MAYLNWIMCDADKNFKFEYVHQEKDHSHKEFETIWINGE
jgi:hypothetical protein